MSLGESEKKLWTWNIAQQTESKHFLRYFNHDLIEKQWECVRISVVLRIATIIVYSLMCVRVCDNFNLKLINGEFYCSSVLVGQKPKGLSTLFSRGC